MLEKATVLTTLFTIVDDTMKGSQVIQQQDFPVAGSNLSRSHGLRNEMHIWLKRLPTMFRRCARFCLGTTSKRLEANKRCG